MAAGDAPGGVLPDLPGEPNVAPATRFGVLHFNPLEIIGDIGIAGGATASSWQPWPTRRLEHTANEML